MTTILENDEKAMDVLGEETTLYGGFIYAGRSYWSTFCIVGRVLAAGDDAVECMGWISSKIVPEELSDRWVDIEVQEVITSSSEARIWAGEAIDKDSNVIGDGDKLSTFSSDFMLLPDLMPNNTFMDVSPASLILSLRAESALTTPTISTIPSEYTETPSIQNYDARMTFHIKSTIIPGTDSGGTQDHFTVTIFLIHDVQFVTAYPCVAQNDIQSILSTPVSSPGFPGQSETIGKSIINCHVKTEGQTNLGKRELILPRPSST